jgi:putative transposase
MLLSYKYRLYPNRGQRQALDRTLEIHRQVYNAALQERREAWKRCRISIGYVDQAKQLKGIRSFDSDVAWCNYSALQQTLRRLKKAFDAFFRRVKAGEKPGYPRFKGKNYFKSVCYVYGDGLKLRDDRLYVQSVGLVRLFQHRPIPDDGTIKMAVLKRDRVGNWYVIMQVELPDPEPAAGTDPAVGIDMGLIHFLALSDGSVIENPRWFRQAEEKLACLQRKRARCKRGSKRYRQWSRQIRRLHQRIADKRRDFQHQLSTRLVREFGFIAVENLNVNGLCRSQVSKSMADAAWAQFLNMLAYKAEKAGTLLVRVDPNGTSQICSHCGFVVPKLLSERQHNCSRCGFTTPRDVNAALNILYRGRGRTGPPRKGFLTPARAGVAGCPPL